MMVTDHALAMCRRMHQTAALASFHFDYFKIINDTHGHAAGDDVLRNFGQLPQADFGTSDVIARLGGDEFAVLCSGATAQELPTSLNRLTNEFRTSPLGLQYPQHS